MFQVVSHVTHFKLLWDTLKLFEPNLLRYTSACLVIKPFYSYKNDRCCRRGGIECEVAGQPELGIYCVEMGWECEAVDRVGGRERGYKPIRGGVDTYIT